MSLIGFNILLSKMNLTQVRLVLNLFTGSISPHYNVLFDGTFYTVVSSTDVDP